MLNQLITDARQREAERKAEADRQYQERMAEQRSKRIEELRKHIVCDLGADLIEEGTLDYLPSLEIATFNLQYRDRTISLHRSFSITTNYAHWYVHVLWGEEEDSVLGREIMVVKDRALVRDQVLCAIDDLVEGNNVDYRINA